MKIKKEMLIFEFLICIIISSCSPRNIKMFTPTIIPTYISTNIPTFTQTHVSTITPTYTPTIMTQIISGLKIATLDENGTLFIRDSSGKLLDKYTLQPINLPIIEWSPNGDYLLVSEIMNAKNIYLIDLINHTTKKWNQVPDNIFRFINKWSPNSDKVVFAMVSKTGSNEKWSFATANSDGSSIYTFPKDWPAINNVPSWSPDGNHLAFTEWDKYSFMHLYILDANTGNIIDKTPKDASQAGFEEWMEDGRLIIFAYKIIDNEHVITSHRILNIVTDEESTFFDDPDTGMVVDNQKFSPSGDRIAFIVQEGKEISNKPKKLTIFSKPTNSDVLTELWHIDQAVDIHIDSWSPSGDYLLFTVQPDASGANRTSYVLDLNQMKAVLLPGLVYPLIERPNLFSASYYWIDKSKIVIHNGDLGTGVSSDVYLFDIMSDTKIELCKIKLFECAIWIK